MSRLIVKNLPSHVNLVQLREHFEQNGGPSGTLTDVKIAHKQDGTSRRFGFIGFKTEQEAQDARNYFDKTFMGTTRISVAVVDGTKNAPSPRPNKRPRLGPSPNDPVKSKPSKSSGVSKNNDQLDEFLDVMKSRNVKTRTWADELPVVTPTPTHFESTMEPLSKKKEKRPTDDDEQIPSKPAPMGDNNQGLSDMEWMKRRMARNIEVEEAEGKAFSQSDEESENRESRAEIPQPADIPVDPTSLTILQTSRLFVRNLAFSCTDTELEELFKPFGPLKQVHIPLDVQTKRPKGVAYVSFQHPADAVSAYDALDKKSFQGRLLHILAAVDRHNNIQVDEKVGKKSVKGDRDAQRKALAVREFNWSMLYMNSDAVASSIADRMNISKTDILNPESDNAAVKLALAETHIIYETKTYLESQGVLLSSFSERARSDTVILVKNIPYGTTVEQITELFQPHGKLGRVLLPPAGTFAVVQFLHADDAAKGFRAIAYRKFGNSMIYLERAPQSIFDGTAEGDAEKASKLAATPIVKIAEQNGVIEDEPASAAGTTLFVKNLSFTTTTDRLTQAFRNLPSFSFARVQTKPDPKHIGNMLSMGYGFVGFKDVDGATSALKGMQGFALDGHALHVKFAGRGTETSATGKKEASKSRTTKMIVKNVPFEATKKDIRELFSAHGQLKSVRLPKKFDSRSRGFAFLDFVTRHEAENAYAALRHTHLLGRHLILEWAEEAEQDLDVLRQKAGVGYGGGTELPGKKRKLDMELAEGRDEDVEED